jgi:small-conductance mechanosensitive channel
MSDSKSAGIVAAGLLGTAALLVFINHLVGLFDLLFVMWLLPGVGLAVILGLGGHLALGPITLFLFALLVNYFWYFILSYFGIKIFRAVHPTIPEAR